MTYTLQEVNNDPTVSAKFDYFSACFATFRKLQQTLPEQFLWICGFECHVHRTRESNKHDYKNDAKTSNIPVDNSCKNLCVQTSGSTKKNMSVQFSVCTVSLARVSCSFWPVATEHSVSFLLSSASSRSSLAWRLILSSYRDKHDDLVCPICGSFLRTQRVSIIRHGGCWLSLQALWAFVRDSLYTI